MSQQRIYPVYLLYKFFIISGIILLSVRINIDKCIIHILYNNTGSFGRTPYMRINILHVQSIRFFMTLMSTGQQ